MEYFLGSLTTLVVIAIVSYVLKPSDLPRQKPFMRYSQSHIFEIVKPLLPLVSLIDRPPVKRQSTVHEDRTHVRVIILDNHAYWIRDNMFYMADIVQNDIKKETARVVDTIGMDKVQLDKMLFIMDQLREGKTNDSGSSGDK
jgi:hypothetical protein